MGKAKIHTLTSTPLGILLVFQTNGGCWQFRVLSCGGAVFGEQKLYYSAEAAEKAGRERENFAFFLAAIYYELRSSTRKNEENLGEGRKFLLSPF